MNKTTVELYKGYEIRKSGNLFKVMQNGEKVGYNRYLSVAAAKVSIDCKGRVMTAEEHAIMYPNTK